MIRVPPFDLPGRVEIPDSVRSVVLFAHGSGSSHRGPRNIRVAEALRKRDLGTLLFDLLAPAGAEDRRNVFDVELLAERLQPATRWLDVAGADSLRLGYYGASTGAAAALVAAARQERPIRASCHGVVGPTSPASCSVRSGHPRC